MLTVAAVVLASCSDDESFNTLQTTVGFEQENIAIKENVGLYNVPIAIDGYRNGDVAVEIVAEGTGANPAVEGKNFLITDKTLSLLADNDTTAAAVLNVQLQTIDDKEINDNRELTLTIKSAQGATVTTSKVVITLRDNDAAFFEKFYGTWTLKGVYASTGKAFEKNVVLTGPNDETDPDYNKKLWATSPGLFNVGVSLDCEWPFYFTFDKETKTGTLSFGLYENYVATYVAPNGNTFQWVFVSDDGQSYTTDPVVATWKLDENGGLPAVIEWDPEAMIYLYQPGEGWWEAMYNLQLVQK